jgi:glycosyltransferase involved in cell wall biosynthesis
MRKAVERHLRVSCTILAFSKEPKKYKRGIDTAPDGMKAKNGFLYVASGEPHKNHRHLVEAWSLLAAQGITPGLCLTLDRNRFPDLCVWIEDQVKDRGLNVTNVGELPDQDLEKIYRESLALIYPSDFESLGLPLIEARCAGLPILASEKDYVRDVVDPEETFDPGSPVSIARAVKRFLEIPEEPLPLMHAREWLSKVCEIARQ